MSAPQTSEELIGTVLNGRWRLDRLIGEGGMGAVFEAEGPPGVGKRAIKLLHHEYAKEAVILARFLAEGQAGKAINHPNVAQVLETAKSETGVPYLVMELLHGTPVASYVDAGQALPLAQAVHIAHGVLQALSIAHGLNIVHRDIKPDNLFLVNDNAGSFNVKVLDFGIAKVMDVAGGMGQKTRTGVLLGTPGYMSPEQIRDSRGVDARADLWSVGIILYELLTGASPFPADNEFTRLTSVLTEEVKPIGDVVPQLASWTGFFQRALAKDPGRRFQSADEMDAALFATLRGRSLRPPPTLSFDPEPSQGSFRPTNPAAVSKNPLQTTAMNAFTDDRAAAIQSAISNAMTAKSAAQAAPPTTPQASPPAHQVFVERPSGVLPNPLASTAPATNVSGGHGSSGVIPSPASIANPQTPGTLSGAQVPQTAPATQVAGQAQAGHSGLIPAPSLQQVTARASVAPPAYSMTPAPPTVGGQGALTAAPVGPTHVSAMSTGTPPTAQPTPSIEVVDAPRRGAPYWVVFVVGAVMFGLGLGLGFVLFR